VRGTIEEKVEELRVSKLEAAGGMERVMNSVKKAKGNSRNGEDEAISLEDYVLLFAKDSTAPSTRAESKTKSVIDVSGGVAESKRCAPKSSGSSSSGRGNQLLQDFIDVADEDD